MKGKLALSSLALFLVLVLAGAAPAQPPRKGHPRGPGLTPEQVAQAFDLRQNFLKDTTALRRQMWVKRAEVAVLWRAEKPEVKLILAKQKEINALKGQLQEKAVALRLKMPRPGFPGMMGPGMGPGRGPGKGMGMGMGMGRPHGRHLRGLTPEQAGQAFDLAEQFREETAGLRKDMAVKRAEVAALWRAEKPEEKLILAKQKELNALKEKLLEKAVPFRLKMRQKFPKAGPHSAACPLVEDPGLEVALAPTEAMME